MDHSTKPMKDYTGHLLYWDGILSHTTSYLLISYWPLPRHSLLSYVNAQFLWSSSWWGTSQKKIVEIQVDFISQLMYVLTLVKPSKSPPQVCNAGLGFFFFTEACLTPHTQCICPGISSPFIHYIVSPYFLQQIICLQPSSYTDPLTPILKAGVIFVALIFRHWGSFKWGLSYFIPKLILTFFSEYCLVLLSS